MQRPHLFVELALTPSEHLRGLSNRLTLPLDHGMLFVFETPKTTAFWNANTYAPLSVGYYDAAGLLIDVFDLRPISESGTPERTPEPRRPYLLALEVPRGWFEANGLGRGTRLPHLAVMPAKQSQR